MAEHIHIREIHDDQARRRLRTIRRGTGSVTWRQAHMRLLYAQDMPVAKITKASFTSVDGHVFRL